MKLLTKPLRNDLLDETSIDFNFGEGYGETWEIVYPSRDTEISVILGYLDDEQSLDGTGWECDENLGWGWKCSCDEPIWRSISRDEECDECGDSFDVAEETLRDEFCDVTVEHADQWEPMMNYAYPAPGLDAGEMQSTLMGTSLCVVTINDEPYLALQGGGMDMRWEICAAYVALDYRPPTQWCELPGMAGRGKSESDRHLIEICARSLELAADLRRSAAERLRDYYSAEENGGDSNGTK